jgi:hypothetical protein
MSWELWLVVFVPGMLTGASITLTVLRPWRPKVTLEAETDR